MTKSGFGICYIHVPRKERLVSEIDAESEMRERARPRESERPRVPFGDGQFERR
jgi:hypothetical protein